MVRLIGSADPGPMAWLGTCRPRLEPPEAGSPLFRGFAAKRAKLPFWKRLIAAHVGIVSRFLDDLLPQAIPSTDKSDYDVFHTCIQVYLLQSMTSLVTVCVWQIPMCGPRYGLD